MNNTKRFETLKEFYPFYLTEHKDLTCRILHFIGTSLFFVVLINAMINPIWYNFIFIVVVPYAFAWVGHFFFEKNTPATFQYPAFSLISDFIMYKDILTGQLGKKMEEAKKQFPS